MDEDLKTIGDALGDVDMDMDRKVELGHAVVRLVGGLLKDIHRIADVLEEPLNVYVKSADQ